MTYKPTHIYMNIVPLCKKILVAKHLLGNNLTINYHQILLQILLSGWCMDVCGDNLGNMK